ncbi:hypothetical protein AB0M95_40650 [Sphaerisporangium sp. NPDC051017]|uniref:hypothetical protein n=1 Tax=unclassified Sphaerisporangium TaxID=2630420 RepID=UPI0033D4F83E
MRTGPIVLSRPRRAAGVARPDALVTLDLPTGLRLATLTVEARQFIAPSLGAGTRESVQFALAGLLYQGERPAEEFERTVNAVRPQRWWRRGHHVLSTARRGLPGGRTA